MTTAIATRTANGTELAHAPAQNGGVIDIFNGLSFSELVGAGNELVRTGFLPQHIQNGTQFAAIVLAGREMGMMPMRAVRSLQMVKGKILEDAASQLARFKAVGGHAVFDCLDETKAILRLTHPNGDTHVETWTLEDSKRAGLVGGNHDKFRKAMLRSRVITAGIKSLGWDGAVGTYDPDEMRVGEPVVEKQASPTAEEQTQVAAKAAAVVAEAKALRADELAQTMRNVVVHAELMLDESVDAEKLAELHDDIGDVAGNSVKLKAALIALSDQVSCRIADATWMPADASQQQAVIWLRGEVAKAQTARTITNTQAA